MRRIIVCPVCGAECKKEETLCKICRFQDESGLSPQWLDVEEAREWLESRVKPYRKEVFSGPCSGCGAQLLEGAKFCVNCGAKAEPNLPPCCVSCETTLPEGAKFCLHCGEAVQETGGVSEISLEEDLQLHLSGNCKYCGGKRSTYNGKCKACGKGNVFTCHKCGGRFNEWTWKCASCPNDLSVCAYCNASGEKGVGNVSGICNSCGRPYYY